MYSQQSTGTRVFSQGGVLSQPTCPDPVPEETHSSRTDAICEENRQIGQFVESSLKHLEKRRIKSKNQKSSIEEEVRTYSEIHERQRQQSIELQMELEEWTDKYQSEINERHKLIDKQEDTQRLISAFEHFFAEAIAVVNQTKKDKLNLHSESEKYCAEQDSIKETKNRIKLSFCAEVEEKIKKCQELETLIIKEREFNTRKIKTLAQQHNEKSNNIKKIQEVIVSHIKSKEELTKLTDDITLQNKMLSEEITKVHKQRNELRAASTSSIQTLHLNINTEQFNNSNLELKRKEKEDHGNVLSTKQSELVHLLNQIKVAIEETSIHNDKLIKKIEENQEKKSLLGSDINTLASRIQENENVENENEFYKNNILTLEDSIKFNETNLKEAEGLCNKLNDQIEISHKKCLDIENNISELNNKLNQSKFDKEELAPKVIKEAELFNQERENIRLQIVNMEQMNLDLDNKSTALSSQLQLIVNSINTIIVTQKQTEDLIERCYKNVKENKEKLPVYKQEFEEKQCKILNENIDIKYKELEKYEELINEIEPTTDKLPELMARKAILEHDIKSDEEKFKEEKDLLGLNFNSKKKEMTSEINKIISVMNNVCAAEEEVTKKVKAEIKGLEEIKTKNENDVRSLHKQLRISRYNEANKRNKVAKMEQRLKAINNEAKITRQDITEAVTGNIQKASKQNNVDKMKQRFKAINNEAKVTRQDITEAVTEDIQKAPIKPHSSTRLMTPMSSDPSMKLKEPVYKKSLNSKGFQSTSNTSNQENKRKWEEYVPDDEYEFTEI